MGSKVTFPSEVPSILCSGADPDGSSDGGLPASTRMRSVSVLRAFVSCAAVANRFIPQLAAPIGDPGRNMHRWSTYPRGPQQHVTGKDSFPERPAAPSPIRPASIKTTLESCASSPRRLAQCRPIHPPPTTRWSQRISCVSSRGRGRSPSAAYEPDWVGSLCMGIISILPNICEWIQSQ